MIAIVQPYIPHYRKEFFERVQKDIPCDIFVYEQEQIISGGFEDSGLNNNTLKSIMFGPLLWYQIRPLLCGRYKTLVLMLNFTQLSTWILLFLAPLLGKKVMLWGQGISVKRYIREEQKPNVLLKLMISMASNIWFYTDKERCLWKSIFPNKPMVALNNTISGVDEILKLPRYSKQEIENLKIEYGIQQEFCFIFCARFNEFRRVDFLLETIKALDNTKYGFIIIGEGETKPDFSNYPNVYDFGRVYDSKVKKKLFRIADAYFQPGWVGLSIVEAMAYGLPIVTLSRSVDTKQCVEFHYLQDGYNSILVSRLEELTSRLSRLSTSDIKSLQKSARMFASENLLMSNMAFTAINNLKDNNR